jgi:hypothetical protein
MGRAILIGTVCVALVIGLFVVNALLFQDVARDLSDGWCDLAPDGTARAADPDCDGWDAGGSVTP